MPRRKPKVKHRIKKQTPKREEPRPVGFLTKFEQETIINFNKEEKTATLFTYQLSLIRHMKKQGAEIEYINSHGGYSFKFPKSWIRSPLTPRNEREMK